MPVTQTKVQVNKDYKSLSYVCRLDAFVNGVPFSVRWHVDLMALELATKDSLFNVIAIMIRGNLDHNGIKHNKADLEYVVNKMMDGMYKYIPELKPKKPIEVPEGWNPFSKDKNTHGSVGQINGKPVSQLAKMLPGVGAKCAPPCNCYDYKDADTSDWTIETCIIHLNDRHGTLPEKDSRYWDREKIAKWLDELHDSGKVNLEFQPWDSEGKEENGN